MSSLPETMHSLMQVFNGKLQDFTNEIDNVHMVWLEEIQQEANRMFSSDFSTEPELMPKTPSQKKTNRRKRVSMELNESRSKRRFSKGKRSNLRRSSVQMTLNTISELVKPHVSNDSSESVMEEPARCTRRNKTTTTAQSEPVKRSTRTKAKVPKEIGKEVAENVLEAKEAVEVQDSGSGQDEMLVSEAMVKISSSERLSAEMLLSSGQSPGRTANKIIITATGTWMTNRDSAQTSVRRSQVIRRSLVGLRHSMTQEAVRRASRRSFLKKKARLGNSTCSSSVSEDICMDVEPGDTEENKEQQVEVDQKVAERATESNNEPEMAQPEVPEPKITEQKGMEVKDELAEEITESPTTNENCRFTRSMARTSETDDNGGFKTKGERSARSGSRRRAAESGAHDISTPKKKHSPPKKCLTAVAPHMRSFMHTVQKNQMLMTPGSLGRSSVIKSFIKQSGGNVDSKERERQKWDALNKKIEQENERKKKSEEERRKKQEEMKRKRDERLKRVVEARVKGEKEKEQEKKKKIEEKMAQLEKKNDMMRVERLAEEKAKRKVTTKRQEELELRKKQEEAARIKKLQQVEEEERRHQEMLSKRKAEEEREKARKQAEVARALELKKEQEREREKDRERERERERQAAAERERLEREKAIALQKELERAAKEKERREMEEKRRMEEQRRAEKEREAQQKRAAVVASAPAPPTVTAQISVTKTQAANMLNTTITKGSALNVTVDIENSVMKTPVGKGAAHNKTVDHGAALNVTVDIEQSPQSYQITPKGQKVTVLMNPEDYGMDQNSDDSTDDESAPRKPIPSWAEGMQLQQAIMKQYYHPLDLNSHFGEPEPPKLEEIFRQTKPRFFKRTSSAVWHSPPRLGKLGNH
ncbi:inner centromere protein A-like isoform X2 [Myxocyprinus asiaticus]|uniref:inner centromere protein A-like isoform X2 n=1 Tax=Myxocyprinus asiaticus TaxID=70543 RepID=UPI0022225295|nr:inner centromere protein A-like isoform X2 [Myxocyprinus asiaticus]